MFFMDKKEKTLEQQLTKNDLAMQELLIRIDVLDREVKTLLDELNITPEQVSAFVSNKDHFTEENWEELRKQRAQLDQKLALQKTSIRDPLKTKKAQAERNVGRHWLFVK